MKRLLLCLVAATFIGTSAHADSERTESLTWTAQCHFQEGSKISHGLRKNGKSLVLGKLKTKFSQEFASLSLTKVDYTSADKTRKTIYFFKGKSPSDDNFINTTIKGNNVLISPDRIEVISNIVNFVLRRNEENNLWHGTLIYFNSMPHFIPPEVHNGVHFVPVVCS